MKLFGTDGIRGKANQHPITPEMAVKVGKGIASYLKKKKQKEKIKIVIGKDTRLSGYMLEGALTSGIVSRGADVLLVGPMPTPAIALLTRSLNADAGIVLSASHNPAEDNGIKFFGNDGFKLNEEEEQELEEEILKENNGFNKIGKAFRINDAQGRYIEFAKSSIKNTDLSGIKIALDCANGAAYHIAPKIFSELGAEVIPFGINPDGMNINHECGATNTELIQRKVLEFKADIGIALDGDADRAMFCDEKGNLIDGDQIIGVCALDLKERNRLENNLIVSTKMSNLGLEKKLKEHGIELIKTDVGDKYVIEEMRKRNSILGGEQSGHIIFSRYSTTGDGIISALNFLRILKNKKQKASELASTIPKFPQTLINVKVKEKKDLNEMHKVNKKINEVEIKLNGNGRTLVRYSGTENVARVMVEGANQKEIESYAQEIALEIKKEIGA